MAATCWSSVRAKVMRATKIDQCGAVVPGAGGTLVSDGLIQVSYSFELDEGTEILQKNGNGVICINEPGCPEVKWLNVEAQFCRVDPDLVNMLTGWPLVLDCAGDSAGFRVRKTIQCKAGIGLELWSDIPGQECEADLVQYGYFLTPWINQGILGDLTLQDGAATFNLSGKARYGSQWGVGPYNVDMEEGSVVDVCDVPGPLLTAIGVDDLMDIHLTTVAPPEATVCGAVELVPAA